MPSTATTCRLIILVCALALVPIDRAATAALVTVTGTGDTVAVDGLVTLREALTSVNGGANVNADVVAVAGPYGTVDTIQFTIPGAGPHTILVGATQLPTITQRVFMSGYTQPGSTGNTLTIGDNAVLNIIVQGTVPGVHGLSVAAGGSGSTIRGLVLQGHFFAIQIAASDVIVSGNFIGTNRGATAAVPNQLGVNISNGNFGNNTIGGATPTHRNVISGNLGGGIVWNSTLPNSVLGNYIGVNGAGTAALPNGGPGITIATGNTPTIGGPVIGGIAATPGTGVGNVISGNGGNGIQIQTTGLPTVIGPGTIQGNLIGLDATGAVMIPNTGHGIYVNDTALPSSGVARVGPITIGGSAAGSGNVVSGHGIGVRSTAVGTVIQGNLIGTDATGTSARANATGVWIDGGGLFSGSAFIGGDTAGEGNVISGNAGEGIRVWLSTAFIVSNRIGISASGAPLGNASHGVFVDSGVATVGTDVGGGNVIANNGDMGVQNRIGFPAVLNASQASILGNSITQNAQLGINNSAAGGLVNPNDPGDPDTGPNNLQNFPVITAASLAAGTVTVSGTLNSEANAAYRVEFFSNVACDASGFGEGKSFLGVANVVTDGGGNATFGPSPFAVPPGETVITATATTGGVITSEFSSCFAAGGAPPLPTLSIDSVSANEGNVGNAAFVFTATLSAASATPVTVAYATADGTATVAGGDYLATSGVLTFLPAGPLSQTIPVDVVGDLTVEPNETFALNLSNPVGATLANASGAGTIVNDDLGGQQAEIPTLSQWGALLLVLSLAGLSIRRMRRSGY